MRPEGLSAFTGRRLMKPVSGAAGPSIDDIDCEILAELQANARVAFAELGRRVGLSTPAVIERTVPEMANPVD